MRCHIGRQRDLYKRTLEEIIETLVNLYLNSILSVRNKNTEVTYILFNVIPPTDECFNPNFPFYGSLEERAQITKLINSSLKKACDKNGLLFLDVYSFYATPQGTLNKELSDNCVHILNNKKVKQELLLLLTDKIN